MQGIRKVKRRNVDELKESILVKTFGRKLGTNNIEEEALTELLKSVIENN